MSGSVLARLGWDAGREEEAHGAAGEPARVATEYRGGFVVIGEAGERPAVAPGKLRLDPAAKPAVGDWVLVEPLQGEERVAIRSVLPRRSSFTRKAAGKATREQIIAANIDVAVVVDTLDGPPNPRRIERYITLALDGGAAVAVVLTKADQVSDPEEAAAAARAVAGSHPVIIASVPSGIGVEEVRGLAGGSRTIAFLGPSGTGKTTLTNALVGGFRAVAEVREDGKGRHTTTSRELIALEGGGCIIDTPGMREIGLWDSEAGLRDAFADVAAVAAGCRFRDCSHAREPGCAVRAAVEDGSLDPARAAAYVALQAETAAVASSARKKRSPRPEAGRPRRGWEDES